MTFSLFTDVDVKYVGWFNFMLLSSDAKLQPHHNLHSGTILNKLLTLGDIGLCAHLAVMVSNTDQYKQVLSQRGPGAQALLNLLQAVCLSATCTLYAIYQLFATALKPSDQLGLQASPS